MIRRKRPSNHQQDGYKAHLVVEPETGLFTAVALRPGSGAENQEAAVGLDLLDDEETAGSRLRRHRLLHRRRLPSGPGTGCSSSLPHCGRPFPAVSPSTTSPSTPPRRP
ncbi:transposase [Streptomyces sp. CB00455]|uniref:transposase n=1 Tax=Streptomyces sp. CB00455 TaxID=1703927 RepID=UPI000A44E8DE|nr:transposase [Streptomyces sp. CB00455]